MPISARITTLLILVASCGFPRPADVGKDAAPDDASADTSADAPDEPGVTVHVSGTGADANDGLTQPVKTLQRAIGIAAANSQITTIVLASGRYDAASGETFPYTVPANIAIRGPAGGGAILVGADAEPGLILDAAKLRDLGFEHFTVAVTGRGTAELANIRVRASGVALRGESSSKLTVTGLDVTGTAGACATGAELNADATLAITNLSSRGLGISLHARDQSTVSVANANITGESACAQDSIGLFTISTSSTFVLDDSLLDGGGTGVYFTSRTAPTHATVSNTTIRNMTRGGVDGSRVVFQMSGGALVNSDHALAGSDGMWSLTGVAIKQQQQFSVLLGAGGVLVMRNCVSTNNVGGIYLYGNMVLDLGTSASHGNNVFQNGNGTTGLEIDGGVSCSSVIDAVGNTWRPNVQEADANGHYSTRLVRGPTAPGGNFTLSTNCMLQL